VLANREKRGKKMMITDNLNEAFENLYEDEKIIIDTITEENMKELIQYANIEVPDFFLEFLKTGMLYGFEIKQTSVIFQLLRLSDILNTDRDYIGFKEDVESGIIVGTDLGGSIYYYGKGKSDTGLYVAYEGAGNYYNEAIKFADTFEDFLIEGKGIDILIKWNCGLIRPEIG